MKFSTKIILNTIKVLLILFVIVNEIYSTNSLKSMNNISLKRHKSVSLLNSFKRRLAGEDLKNVLADAILHKVAHDLAYGKGALGSKAELDGKSVMKYIVDKTSLNTNTRMIFGQFDGEKVGTVLSDDIRKQTAMIVFRGTADTKNAKTDIDGQPILARDSGDEPAPTETGSKIEFIHQGFKKALKDVLDLVNDTADVLELYEELKTFLNVSVGKKNDGTSKKVVFKHIIITGHSLGGALAVTMAHKLLKDQVCPGAKIHLATFGAPRVGNKAFADFINNHSRIGGNLRFVYGYDIVAHLPPKNKLVVCQSGLFVCPEGFEGYVHAGTWIGFDIESDNLSAGGASKFYKYKGTNTIGLLNQDNQPEGVFDGEILTLAMKIGINNFIDLGMGILSYIKSGIIKVTSFTNGVIIATRDAAVDATITTFAVVTKGANQIKIVFSDNFQKISYYSQVAYEAAKKVVAQKAADLATTGLEVGSSLAQNALDLGESFVSGAQCALKVITIPANFIWDNIDTIPETIINTPDCLGNFFDTWAAPLINLMMRHKLKREKRPDHVQRATQGVKVLTNLVMAYKTVGLISGPALIASAAALSVYIYIAGSCHLKYKTLTVEQFKNSIQEYLTANPNVHPVGKKKHRRN